MYPFTEDGSSRLKDGGLGLRFSTATDGKGKGICASWCETRAPGRGGRDTRFRGRLLAVGESQLCQRSLLMRQWASITGEVIPRPLAVLEFAGK